VTLYSSNLYNVVDLAMQDRKNDDLLTSISAQQLLSGLRMLIVDDSEINRELTELVFVNGGAHVVLANDGQQAVDWLQAHPTEVDIVLMDVQMPVMDGYEATRQIRRVSALAELPVLALTAGDFVEQKELAREAGMNDFIAKPIDVDTAIELILKHSGWFIANTRVKPSELAPLAPAMDLDLPGLAIGYALSLWKDATTYQQYLRKFVRDYANSVQVITHSEKCEAEAFAHKLKGAVGSLGLQQVAELAGEVERAFHDGGDPADSLTRLQMVLNTALESIERYAPPDLDTKNVQFNAINTEQLARLFARMLDALNTDSMTAIRPILAELDKILPPTRLMTLHLAVENFDFRDGEDVIRTLANDLNILMET